MTIDARPWRRTLAAPRSISQHGVAQMHARGGIGKDVGEQQALIDLVTVLGAQRLLQLAFERGAIGHQARVGDRGALAQCVGTQMARALLGEDVIDVDCMNAQETLAGFAHNGEKLLGSDLFIRRPRRARRQTLEQARARTPETAEALAVRRKIVARQREVGGIHRAGALDRAHRRVGKTNPICGGEWITLRDLRTWAEKHGFEDGPHRLRCGILG
ncbi:MAG: hypothetical protein P8Y76_08190 [bacterium]